MIEGRGISLSLGGTPVLKDVAISLAAGEVVALCGPNGAGKSTLLACLAGEHQDCSTSVEYSNVPLIGIAPRELARLRVVLEQNPSLTAEFTVSELLELGTPLELPTADLERLKVQMIAEFGFSEMRDAFVSTLSGGQQHRAHLARILIQLQANRFLGHTCCLFMDEPTASLDIRYQINVLQKMRDLAEDGVGVLVVLHDLNLAAAFSDRIVLMRDGQITHAGTPVDVLRENVLSDVYETGIFVEHASNGQVIIQPRL
ncbi:MAG: ATP-binding cassette domain-containing protein [Pseudomonadota bacterium]